MDGIGEWATTSIWLGDASELKLLWQINFASFIGASLLKLYLFLQI
jgi:carbamoyltransferase